MSIDPDTKDWTWVLERPCPDCGFDAQAVDGERVPSVVRRNAADWQRVLTRPDVRRRPGPQVWSPLEYGCHVRDVLRLFDQRLALMLSADDPMFPDWDQDETAVRDRYPIQDPVVVAAELLAAAQALASRLAAVPAADRWRPGRRSNGSTFTVDSLARYMLHDLEHHLHDVA